MIASIKDAPEWLHDDFLIHGYRINHHKTIDILKSLFSMHNETLNIWSHLIGVIVFISLAVILIWQPGLL